MKIAMRFVLWAIPFVCLSLVCLSGADLRVAAGTDAAQSPKTEPAPSRGAFNQADAAPAVLDLQGRSIDPFGAAKAKAVVRRASNRQFAKNRKIGRSPKIFEPFVRIPIEQL